MANTDKAWQQGQRDANAGKGASNQSNQSWQVQKAYEIASGKEPFWIVGAMSGG